MSSGSNKDVVKFMNQEIPNLRNLWVGWVNLKIAILLECI